MNLDTSKVVMALLMIITSIPALAVKVNNPNCTDLVEVKDTFTPEYIALLDGYGKRGTMTGAQIDIAGLVTETGKVKDECMKDKTAKVKNVRKEMTVAPPTNNPAPNTLQADIDRKPKSTINPIEAKCSDFVALAGAYQPVAAFWVAGHSKAGKVSGGEIDEVYLEQPIASLVEDCKAAPTASFYDKTKAWFKKHI